jgi:CRP-like cAMP-binding protein
MIAENQYLGPFEPFNNILRAEFQKYAQVIKFTKSDYPFSSDDSLEWFYIIVSGKVKVYEINFETNREQTLYLLVRGDMFDVVTLLDGNLHELAVDVLEAGEALRFPIDKVREWMQVNQNFQQLIYKYVANQIRNIESLAIDLSLYETRDRLLKLLLKNVEFINKKGVNLLDSLSHSEIASLIGTVRHIIDRHLKDLKSKGIIDKEKKNIILKDATKVLDMLNSL